MTIKDGYNNKPTSIRISGENNGYFKLWITQEGIPEDVKTRETLSYITLDELLALKQEICQEVKALFS